MGAEQIGFVTALLNFLKILGFWPGLLVAALVVLCLLTPWFVIGWIMRTLEKGSLDRHHAMEKQIMEAHERAMDRFEAVRSMYEDNVKLVESYEKMHSRLFDAMIYNSERLTALNDAINSNLFCPIVRKKTKQMEVDV